MPSDHSLQVFEFITDIYHNLINILHIQYVEKSNACVNVFKGPAGMFVLCECNHLKMFKGLMHLLVSFAL